MHSAFAHVAKKLYRRFLFACDANIFHETLALSESACENAFTRSTKSAKQTPHTGFKVKTATQQQMTIAGRTALGQSLFATTLIASLPRISAIKGISETVSKRQRASESILALDLCPAASNHPYAFYPASFHGADRKHVRNIRGGNP